MKESSLINGLLAFALLVACVLGCNKADVKTSENPGTEKKTAPLKAETSPPADIAGKYAVTGTNENGSPYKGELEVIKHGSVYQFRWNTGKPYDGVGVQNGNVVAAAFTGGSDGTGCGVVSYRLLSDGKLDGKWGYWGRDESGTETAERTSGSGLAGDYTVTGTNPGGTSYQGTLKVSPQGGGYTFTWSNGSAGFGIKQGETISVGIGGSRCGFIAYQIKSGATLEGVWGGYGTYKTGTEHATKK